MARREEGFGIMTISNTQFGVHVSGMPLSASAGIPADHRAEWAPAAAAPQHKRRTADGIAESVNRGTT
jgi:hypothetical protein